MRRRPHIAGRGARPAGAAGVLLLTALLGCSRQQEAEPGTTASGTTGAATGGIVAQVNDAKLTEGDLQRIVPDEFRDGLTGAEVRDILDRWVDTELLYQRARRDGLDRDPQVDARVRDLERDLLADELLQRELATRVRVTSDELQSYYRRHLTEYTTEVQLKQILVNTREDAEEILQMLRNGAQFESLARQRSLDPTAAQAGDLGFLGKGQMNPAFEPFVFSMQVGEFTRPIATTFGFHIVKVAAKRPAADPVSFDAARDEIMHTLLLEKQQTARVQFLKELRTGAQVQMASSYAGMSLAPEAVPAPETQNQGTPPRPGAARAPDSLAGDRD